MSRLITLISIFICVSFIQSYAQTLNLIQSDEDIEVYELVNDSLLSSIPLELTIFNSENGSHFRITEQKIVQRLSNQKQVLSGLKPIIEVVGGGYIRKKQVSRLHIHVSRVQGTVEYVTQYLRFEVIKPKVNKALKRSTSAVLDIQNHPLSTGKWVKIEYNQLGIYEITPNQMSQAGFEVSSLDPRKIQIWGTDGLPAPELNSAAYQTFSELPIIVKGEQDGKFDSDDRIYFFGNTAYASKRNLVGADDYTFVHTINPYTTSNYVFLTVGNVNGKRMSVSNSGLNSTTKITTFTDHIWKEDELYKSEEHMQTGKNWLGQVFSAESFGRTSVILQDTVLGFVQGSQIQIKIRYYARSTNNSVFTTKLSNQIIGNSTIPRIYSISSDEGLSADKTDFLYRGTHQLGNNILSLSAEFSNNLSGSNGWVDYIDIELQRKLIAKRGKLLFFPPKEYQKNQPAEFVLEGFQERPIIIDASNPYQPSLLDFSFNSDKASVVTYPDPQKRVIAQDRFYTPLNFIEVKNQNISGTTYQPDYIIVTAPEFLEQAQRLATFHQNDDHFKTLVVTQEQVFNEFTGGNPDVMGTRLLLRHFYKRATSDDELPQYLLLFGDTHFDFKGILKDATLKNHVFTYESPESIDRVLSYGSDDFFGVLDDEEGVWIQTNELIDIGIGRLPVQTENEAKKMVDKIIHYGTYGSLEQSSWKTLYTFAADDEFPNPQSNKDLHVLNADGTAQLIDQEKTGIRLKKIYLFDYPVENTAAGRRIPLASRDLIQTLNNGTLVFNYSGHGAEQILADERFLTTDMIPELTNFDRLNIFVTATCSFGRFDALYNQSGAEQLVLHPDGGSIAAFTTTRVVYTGADPNSNNYGLNRALTQAMITRESQTNLPRRLGDIYQITKTTGSVGPSINSRKFILLGDPALRMATPSNQVKITSVDSHPIDNSVIVDVSAMQEITISGEIVNENGNTAGLFNGEMEFMILDSERFVNVPVDRWGSGCFTPNCGYWVQNDILFNGRSSVSNGFFTLKFILPKDIGFNNQTSALFMYGKSADLEASGGFNRLRVTSINPNSTNDGKGPELEIYLNDIGFMNGSIVNQNPTLFVKLSDETGINTAASGIGHELTAQIQHPDGSESTTLLNDYLQTQLNDYKSGEVNYTFDRLKTGDYQLKVRAWDIFNNPNEQKISFTVTSDDDLVIRNVYNYPNPMHSKTKFVIEHNQPGSSLSVTLRIYTLSGRPVYQYNDPLFVTSSPFITFDWDGRDRDGDKLATGTYLYHIKVKADTPDGKKSVERIEKLVIIQ